MEWEIAMLLNLAKIIDCPGGVVDFETQLDLHTMDFGGSCPVSEPVQIKGVVRNTAGVLVLDGQVATTLHGICDRCTREFTRYLTFPVKAVLVTELASEENEDQETFLLEGECADLEDIFTTAFVLNMDTKLLCKEDCKGLCARCGKNLNDGPCDCQPEIDPRFAALKQLLK